MDYKHLGAIAVFILVIGLTFVVTKWPRGTKWSFSQHVAPHKAATMYYTALFGFVLPLLLLFFFKWFMPNFELLSLFGVAIAISCISQFICTLIPEIGGWKTKWHRVFAGISAAFLIPTLIILMLSPQIDTFILTVTISSLVVMLGIIYLLWKNNGVHPKFLILQAVYFTAFFIPVIVATYKDIL